MGGPAKTLEVPVKPEELGISEMLGCLPPGALEDLAAAARRRRFVPGDALFHEGDPGTSLHVLTRGLVKVVRPTRDKRLVLDRIEPGHVFGELAVLNSGPRTASVIAIDETETVEILKEDFERVLDRHPEGARRMLGQLATSLTLAKEEVARQNRHLEAAVRERTADLRESQLEVVRRLSHAAESRDQDTGLHITRMSRLCARLASGAGASPEEAELILYAAPMHDVGKIGIPDQILLKPGKLSPHEWEIMKTHTEVGARLLSGSRSPVVKMGELIALTHHEKWDGSGYPRGLKGEAIPFVARITAICDVFDALISDRPYKDAWPVERAFEEIKSQSGRHFDPLLVEVFVEIFPEIRAIVEEPQEEDSREVSRNDAPARR